MNPTQAQAGRQEHVYLIIKNRRNGFPQFKVAGEWNETRPNVSNGVPELNTRVQFPSSAPRDIQSVDRHPSRVSGSSPHTCTGKNGRRMPLELVPDIRDPSSVCGAERRLRSVHDNTFG